MPDGIDRAMNPDDFRKVEKINATIKIEVEFSWGIFLNGSRPEPGDLKARAEEHLLEHVFPGFPSVDEIRVSVETFSVFRIIDGPDGPDTLPEKGVAKSERSR